ncbi:hypothetical protein, partial [Citrobacter freundii]|uniref:hypothetical protein n=1 Tax=Citrobacter freundii TaxID=546 RepID=UPI001952C7CE
MVGNIASESTMGLPNGETGATANFKSILTAIRDSSVEAGNRSSGPVPWSTPTLSAHDPRRL